jgi:trehalose 6-phosphate synthase/phosphatase
MIGSFIERKRCALTWHYRLADPEQGIHMSRECQKELEAGVAQTWDVDVMTGKANLEVRPTFINKGEICKRLVATYNAIDPEKTGKVEFVICSGDDFTDEDMFRALNGLSGQELEPDQVFTITVGPSSKVTLAKYHLLEPEDVIDCATLLAAGADGTAGTGGEGEGGDMKEIREKLGEVNLAALSAVEGHIPSTESKQ